MHDDPGEHFLRRWQCDILDKEDPLSMWFFFTDPLVSLLDEDSADHLIHDQGHIVRMHFYFSIMSFLTESLNIKKKYIVNVNDEDYLLKNIRCIQKVNKTLTYEYTDGEIRIKPLPIIFKIDHFSDRQIYQIPAVLGGASHAYSIFADYN